MKSYLKFLGRNKLYTLIEAVGLAASLAFVIIIGNYAYQQLSIPHEHPEYERVYEFGMPNCPGLTYGFTDILKERIPEVESVTQYSVVEGVVPVEGENVAVKISCANADFYDMFPYYELVSGTPDLLKVPTNVFVSETFANTHGIEVGETLKIDGNVEVTVAGIAKDYRNTLFTYADIIMPVKSFIIDYYGLHPFDQFGSVITFAKVAPGTDREAFYAKAEALCKEIYPSIYGSNMFEHLDMLRFDELFFRNFAYGYDVFNRGDSDSLKILILVGILLLLSAIFNYVNLSVALTGRRAKEMATRRLLGASKMEIFAKYIAESVTFTAMCFACSLLLAEAMVPVVNTLLNNPEVPVSIGWTSGSVLAYIFIILLVGTVVGVAPAALASRFKPIDVIKGTFRAKNKMTFSKVFIVIQNAMSVFLLAMALVMEGQYATALNRPMHSNIEDKYYLFVWNVGKDDYERLGESLRELPFVKRLGFAMGVPGFLPGGQYSLTRDGQEIMYRTYRMDSTAFDMLEIEVLKDYGAPKYNSVWFGEKAFAATGLDDDYLDISNTLGRRAIGCEHVAGIVADFPNNKGNIGTEDYMVLSVMRRQDIPFGGWVIETEGDHKEAERRIKEVYEKFSNFNPSQMKMSSYIDDYIREQMSPTRNNMRLIEIFMLLSIMISLLGLVAMSTYYASESSRDIAVRKVFGATVESEVYGTVRRYMSLVLVSLFIGIPFAVWASGRYLEQFIWRLEGYWWIFVAAALLTLVFALCSVLYQVTAAARTNPASELKKE